MIGEWARCYYCGRSKNCPVTVSTPIGEQPACEWCAAEQFRDWQWVEELMDREDVRLAREEAARGEVVSWEQVKAEEGLR